MRKQKNMQSKSEGSRAEDYEILSKEQAQSHIYIWILW